MAQLTAPAHVPPPVRGGEVNRVTARIRSTPGRLVVVMLVLLLVGLLAGIAWVIGSSQRSSSAGSARTGSGRLAVQAQELYRALSDADATAAIAFLSSGVEPADLRNRYQSDVAAATAALAAVANGGASDKAAIQQISAQLPVYTGLVETARSYNRQGYPVGSAYLREASGLMREQLLPAAQRLYDRETTALRDERDDAASLPWLALLLGVGLVAGLIRAGLRLSRQTHRTFNAGLLAATLVAVVIVIVLWNGIGWAVVAAHIGAANRDGSRQVELLAKARIAALTARADEALTLVARGSGAAFEEDYVVQLGALVNDDNKSGLLDRARAAATDGAVRASIDTAISDVNAWLAVHKKLRAADDGGDFPGAVKLAIGSEPDSAATIFNRLDGVLAQAIHATSAVSDKRGAQAAGAFAGQTGGGVFLTIVLLAGIGVGYQQRIVEYR
ncbi:hypothetical protein ABT297_38990 [Dactylosporangium sp. NPDC000555]|uniref:hypothetical protein n=1 Tax=Dactylosporangium sp. NPDC000555 TaxID=3154260 RepID=UPI0033283EF9